MGDVASMPKLCWKIAYFLLFLGALFIGPDAHFSLLVAKNDYPWFLQFQAEINNGKLCVTCHDYKRYLRHCSQTDPVQAHETYFHPKLEIFNTEYYRHIHFWTFHIILRPMVCDNLMFWPTSREIASLCVWWCHHYLYAIFHFRNIFFGS